DQDTDLEAEKKAAIAKCKRKIEAARALYLDGELSREDYLQRKEHNEREIGHWEARTSDIEALELELAACLDTVAEVAKAWAEGKDEDRQSLANCLFEDVFYDLDARRIIDFRLKPWADKFLNLRAALYANESGAGNSTALDGKGSFKGRTVICPHGAFDPGLY